MYEFNNVPEPTCEGWWWRCGTPERPINSGPFRVTQDSAAKAWLYWTRHNCQYRCDEYKFATWTGPIPIPEAEDKPFKKTPFFRHDTEYISSEEGAEMEAKRADEILSKPPEDKPAPSEDDEKWGRRLWHYYRDRSQVLLTYDQQPKEQQRKIDRAAIRFRDECVGPWRKLGEAARLLGETSRRAESATDEIRADWIISYRDMMRLLGALPDQGEAAKTEEDTRLRDLADDLVDGDLRTEEDKPRASDEELGRGALEYLLQDLLGWTPERVQAFGAAIRAKLGDS